MQLPALLTSDLHLTANPKDEYRWSLFPWLADVLKSEGCKTLLIGGDISDAKDYHSATFTNRMVRSLVGLRDVVDRIVVLGGNHDYLREHEFYFDFLNHIPGIEFITRPTEDRSLDGPSAYFLPHTHHPERLWSAGHDYSHYDYLFMHQTVSGAVASNGMRMEGTAIPALRGPKIYSGDIHVPQVIGNVEYIGSPYQVHFGDRFEPRCVLLDRRNRPVDLKFETIQRLTLNVSNLRALRAEKLRAGDQVKLRMHLSAEDKHDWHRIKREATAWLHEQRVEVHNVELVLEATTRRLIKGVPTPQRLQKMDAPDQAVIRYVEAEGLGADALDIGLELV